MNNQQQIVELAKAMRDSEWLCSFRTQETRQLAALAAGLISEDVDRLLDLIDPQPVGVDWGKAIGCYGGGKLIGMVEHVGMIDPPDANGFSRTIFDRSKGYYEQVREDGTIPGCAFWYANTPDPAPIREEIGYEICFATHYKHGNAIAIRMIGSIGVNILTPDGRVCGYASEEGAITYDWILSPWHPRTVTR